jgi:hypothetical protein
MNSYEVFMDKTTGDFYVKGLKSERGGADQRLFYEIPYPETETPEFADPNSEKAMHSALYDLYQWHDGLHEGDRFTTQFGNFKCVSFHVVKDL